MDQVINEPKGGARRIAGSTIDVVGETIQQFLNALQAMDRPASIKESQKEYLHLRSKGLAA